MSQSSIVVANAAPSVVRAAINSALAAIASDFSGAAAPSTTWPLMKWADTTANILKIRNLADDAWISFMDLTTGNILTNAAGLSGTTGGKWVNVLSNSVSIPNGGTQIYYLRNGGQHNLYMFSVYSNHSVNTSIQASGSYAAIVKGFSSEAKDYLDMTNRSGSTATFYCKVWAWEA